jgi:hypothetical protein
MRRESGTQHHSDTLTREATTAAVAVVTVLSVLLPDSVTSNSSRSSLQAYVTSPCSVQPVAGDSGAMLPLPGASAYILFSSRISSLYAMPCMPNRRINRITHGNSKLYNSNVYHVQTAPATAAITTADSSTY